jgi:hypothetical protein
VQSTTHNRYAVIAEGHRRKAALADNEHERMHWIGEAHRFDQLADMAPGDALYHARPTVAYDPERPVVHRSGTCIVVTLPRLGTAYLNRDRLTTTYLALLDRADETHGATVRVKETLVAEHGFDSTEATRLIIGASALIRYNIEP